MNDEAISHIIGILYEIASLAAPAVGASVAGAMTEKGGEVKIQQ